MTESPVVKVEQGQLQGKVVTSPSGKSFFSFQGIPYAKPPLGSLRFKAPQPAESWQGIRDATAEGNVSAQIDTIIHKQFIGDENCLFLNIYTPNLDGEFLPVMIFIHGGGFKFGSGNSSFYGGDYLVERDVVVVTINYRCGALGFLCLNTPEVPGNAGLKDMVQAIKWVKDNIHNFGGNAGNVTLFGESAGGVAVSLLTASPLTKDLISKAIIQSGTALNSWAFQKNPIENAKTLAKALGSDAEDIDDLLEFLSATPVREMVDASNKLHPPQFFFERGSVMFAPVVEKEFHGVEAALTEAFVDVLTSGRVSNVPIMIGSTTLEFTVEPANEDLRTFIPDVFNLDINSEEAVAIADKIKRLYFKSGHIGMENLSEYFQLLSDKLVNVDTHRYVKYLVQVASKPIYYYKFDYVGELNISKKLLDGFGLHHAAHMDEMGYLFKNILQADVEPTSQDIKMRERMLRLWTNFAKTGNPTPEESHYITVTWQPVTRDNLYYLNLGNELSLDTNPDSEKMSFWDELYNKYYKIWEHPKVNNEVVPEKVAIPKAVTEENANTVTDEPIEVSEPITATTETLTERNEEIKPLVQQETANLLDIEEPAPQNGNLINEEVNGNTEPVPEVISIVDEEKKEIRTSNEIKMASQSNGGPKDVIRANDPPEDDLPKNIGVNKFVNFFESLGGKKKK